MYIGLRNEMLAEIA